MIDADYLHRFSNWLRVYFVDNHLLGTPALILLGVLALIGCEALVRDWKDTAMYRLFFRRSTSAKIDIVYYLLQAAGVVALLEMIFSLGIAIGGARLADYTSNQLSWARIPLPGGNILEIAFSFVVFWIVGGFFSYWIHRLHHTSIFWQVHRFHHSAPELNFITAYRLHPLESLLRAFDFLSPMILLKAPDSVILVSVVVGNFVIFCQHSEMPWDWGWIGRWIFSSPRVHQLHHSIDDEHRDTNFCNCPLWDHVFGTWYDGSKMPSRYGIPDPAYEEQPFRQFLRDGWIVYMRLGSLLLQPFRKALSWARSSSSRDAELTESVATTRTAPEQIST